MSVCRFRTVALLLLLTAGSGVALAGLDLDLDARVGCARRIEAVYHGLRTWPAQNPGDRPPLDEVLPESALRDQVRATLAASALLEREWDAGVTTADLQAELDRMARATHAPGQLRTLFAALDDDPRLIAECLARPLLVDRRARALHAARVAPAEDGGAPFEAWLQARLDAADGFAAEGGDEPLTLPAVTGEPCAPDSWQPTAADLPGRQDHAAVWTGSEMLLYGGGGRPGMRYSPATDSWRGMSEAGAPHAGPARAVWTGTEMITWSAGGGGRYDPAADEWRALPLDGAPSSRSFFSVVWTGSEMVVWGGIYGTLPSGDGARYAPATDRWTAVSMLNAPSARAGHSAVWSGTEMIVWGGYVGVGPAPFLADGGRYTPATDMWVPLSTQGAPAARSGHTAVWTGAEMIVWGGQSGTADATWVTDTGARYAPALDSWTELPTAGAPRKRRAHTAVWADGGMIVWGGEDDEPVGSDATTLLASGAWYSPETNAWRALWPPQLAARKGHSAVWAPETGEMIVWGGTGSAGLLADGSRYRRAQNRWTPTAGTGVPGRRSGHTAVWTGAEMIVWGGRGPDPGNPYLDTGARYDPALDAWRALPGSIGGRTHHTAVWTGTEMLIYGGDDGWHSDPMDPTWLGLSDAAAYSPARNAWRGLAPGGRRTEHGAVWTGTRMIVWGGYFFWDLVDPPEQYLWSGRVFDPVTNTWTDMTRLDAPAPRMRHLVAWTGRELLVWGGFDGSRWLITGGLYDPADDHWRALATSGAPSAEGKAGAWAEDRFVVWGGESREGAQIVPGAAAWSPLPMAGAPPARSGPTATWTGLEVVFWGGEERNDGGRYAPSRGEWLPLGMAGAPDSRSDHTAIWTGSHVIVWGGSLLSTGGRYCGCLAEPVAASSGLSVTAVAEGARVAWESLTGAVTYDVVAGPLATLRQSAGDYSKATDRCLADDLGATELIDAVVPASGDGTWYLVRGVNCSGGTYASEGGGQVRSPDAGIGGAAAACR